ncbi:uncharacterized protein PHACADRAFT_259331 [Phanerochaete carnosa HHB-10118-sp]|uniref:Heme peroxidase n=1 Tax=Phanerochaete carnosa (strain HHB-10118-sp) TaxID=650164 RepID=K5UT67_PHACS|nr:uncharacterized protein PHACADRAFT_259331 [Phanerochaete carnosa HHB-10118-sp]EKM53146.1 hypothetical protein PHACADRAFT_259331 [Phanerochaete carnosa HHB-10118-sp]
MLLEKVLVWMADHSDWALEHRLESIVVNFLYKDLPHPPAGYLSVPNETSHALQKRHKGVTYAFRTADGSDYNVLYPELGKAGVPYARSVPSTLPLPASALPDPGLVFDMLLKRDKFVPHPGGVSSLFFAFADLVIHSIFNTDQNDPTINNASSYLDLSPLYGSSEAQVDSIRRKDGTGRLKEDVFADGRLLFMPPSTCALLVLLCRNHNYTASKLLAINERGTFRAPGALSGNSAALAAQDDELFARARLVNCGLFMQAILGDYVGAILGLVRDGRAWRLKILEPYRTVAHDVAPRGDGNVVSVEFNLMYRWHAALSAPDTAWAEDALRRVAPPGKDPATLTREDMKKAYGRLRPPADVQQWTFGSLKRDEKGRFRDVDLAKILQDATEAEAGAFRARGIPEAMKVVELMAIEQARSWGTCSLNEFRRFMGLKPYSSFSEWNQDEDVANAARMLYHDIENLELYVGLQAEEAKPPGPGAGLCPGYTISRAILSDAVALTRGDRFLTTEFTPQNLTAWGYADCQFDVNDGSYGGMLTKLLFRTLPECYPAGSAYAHFPSSSRDTCVLRWPGVTPRSPRSTPGRAPSCPPVRRPPCPCAASRARAPGTRRAYRKSRGARTCRRRSSSGCCLARRRWRTTGAASCASRTRRSASSPSRSAAARGTSTSCETSSTWCPSSGSRRSSSQARSRRRTGTSATTPSSTSRVSRTWQTTSTSTTSPSTRSRCGSTRQPWRRASPSTSRAPTAPSPRPTSSTASCGGSCGPSTRSARLQVAAAVARTLSRARRARAPTTRRSSPRCASRATRRASRPASWASSRRRRWCTRGASPASWTASSTAGRRRGACARGSRGPALTHATGGSYRRSLRRSARRTMWGSRTGLWTRGSSRLPYRPCCGASSAFPTLKGLQDRPASSTALPRCPRTDQLGQRCT